LFWNRCSWSERVLMNNSSIRAVIFDFGGVICSFDVMIFVRRIAPHSRFTMNDLSGGVLHGAAELARRYETGLLSSEEFYREVAVLAGLTMPMEDFAQAYCDIFSPIPLTLDLIRSLKGRYRLAMLSNTSEWHFELGIKSVDVFPLFETVTLSYQVGAMKPDPRIYQDALRKLALSPGACAYIDDLAENVSAAASIGMHAVRYTTHETLAHDLRGLGLEW